MSDPYLGEIRIFAFDFAPRGWALCQGQTLPINQNQALFALLGTTYGGDGVQSFKLPDLRDRAPMHFDATRGTVIQGQTGGETAHTLTVNEMPAHTHAVAARAGGTLVGSPTGALWAQSAQTAFGPAPNVTMATGALGSTGNNQAHDNLPPYLVLSFAIALVGIFPSRN